MRSAIIPLILVLATPVAVHAASADPEAWSSDGEVLHANAAGIGLPQTTAGLSLVKSGEIADGDEGGQGLDNYAQFTSSDGVIQATAYIYRPSYADAAISAYMTDKAIRDRFGPAERTAYGVAPAGAHPHTAIRASYRAADGALVTTAAFVHAGPWLVKLRVTGPAERAEEVESGMTGLLSGLQFDSRSTPSRVAASAIGACPVADGPGASTVPEMQAGRTDSADAAFPRDGQDTMCIRGTVTVGNERYDMLQASAAGSGASAVVIPLNDAGRVMRLDGIAATGGYRLTVHEVGGVSIESSFDRLPSTRQIAAVIDGDALTDAGSATKAPVARAITGAVRAAR